MFWFSQARTLASGEEVMTWYKRLKALQDVGVPSQHRAMLLSYMTRNLTVARHIFPMDDSTFVSMLWASLRREGAEFCEDESKTKRSPHPVSPERKNK